MKKKKKPVKFHMSAGNNPRINVENLKVVNHLLVQKPLNDYIVLRLQKDLKLRTIPLYIPDKDYEMMLIDIKKKVRLSAKTIKPYLYLFAEGMTIALINSEKNRPKEEEKKAEETEGKETEDIPTDQEE